MTQKGTHTWDLIQQYHACPKCGFINESREDFYYRLGEYVKDMVCGRCSHAFRLKKNRKETFGPLIGSPQPSGFEWE